MTVTDTGMKELLLSSELLSAKGVFGGSFYRCMLPHLAKLSMKVIAVLLEILGVA